MSPSASDPQVEFDPERLVVRDKRRIDPDSGVVREAAGTGWRPPAGTAEPVPQDGAVDPRLAELEGQLAERTQDLQRVQAEYANYRRRVDRDRAAVVEQATAGALFGLLPVLDDVGRAREHGELEGAFRSVGEALESAVQRLGLVQFGEPGDGFDPAVHEALTHSYSADVTGPTAVQIYSPGYRLGSRVLRPARVAVAEPEAPSGGASGPGPDAGTAADTAAQAAADTAPDVTEAAADAEVPSQPQPETTS